MAESLFNNYIFSVCIEKNAILLKGINPLVIVVCSLNNSFFRTLSAGHNTLSTKLDCSIIKQITQACTFISCDPVSNSLVMKFPLFLYTFHIAPLCCLGCPPFPDWTWWLHRHLAAGNVLWRKIEKITT